MKSEAPLAPGVKVPPPVIYVIALLIVFFASTIYGPENFRPKSRGA